MPERIGKSTLSSSSMRLKPKREKALTYDDVLKKLRQEKIGYRATESKSKSISENESENKEKRKIDKQLKKHRRREVGVIHF